MATLTRETLTPQATRPRVRDGLALAAFVGTAMAAGALGTLATRKGLKTWYPRLDKPGFTPPNWLFAPVWTSLYAAMGTSAWLVWRQPPSPARQRALALYGVQLGLNAAWSPLFFGMRAPGAALADLGAMWGTLGAYAVTAWPVSRPASLLFAPYIAWTSYAGALNASIWLKNGDEEAFQPAIDALQPAISAISGLPASARRAFSLSN